MVGEEIGWLHGYIHGGPTEACKRAKGGNDGMDGVVGGIGEG
jgi:hypothetical protein